MPANLEDLTVATGLEKVSFHSNPKEGQYQRMLKFSSVAQLYLTLCDPMDCSISGFPVHHQLLELTQTHALRVGDAIQPSHLLLMIPFYVMQNAGLDEAQLESKFLRDISITSDMQMTSPLWQKTKRN